MHSISESGIHFPSSMAFLSRLQITWQKFRCFHFFTLTTNFLLLGRLIRFFRNLGFFSFSVFCLRRVLCFLRCESHNHTEPRRHFHTKKNCGYGSTACVFVGVCGKKPNYKKGGKTRIVGKAPGGSRTSVGRPGQMCTTPVAEMTKCSVSLLTASTTRRS